MWQDFAKAINSYHAILCDILLRRPSSSVDIHVRLAAQDVIKLLIDCIGIAASQYYSLSISQRRRSMFALSTRWNKYTKMITNLKTLIAGGS